ncbi:MAG: nucleotide exchange factor GrpE [Alphaproteobacteria bacterium]|nr:nucleotide exchange factor GrpE [Alphaproteobacteria bacterium]
MDNNNVPPLETGTAEDLEKMAEELEKKAETETQELTSLEGEVANLKDQWLRAMAETENLRRRATKDREEALKYASANFGRDMLAIADNLRRALESCGDVEALPESVKALIQGIELTESALLSTFERHGIKKIEPLNEKFDANLHQAMFEVEDASVAAGTVVQVLQVGYSMHERLLRPAMVGVSKVTGN